MNAEAVRIALVKAAGDSELEARMEKSARAAWLSRMLGGAAKNGRISNVPMPPAPRVPNITVGGGPSHVLGQPSPFRGAKIPTTAPQMPQSQTGMPQSVAGNGQSQAGLGRKLALLGGFGAAGTAGAAGAGTVGYGHLQNDAQDTVGRSFNPLTWLNPNSRQQVFSGNVDRANQMQGGMHNQIASALASGDFDTAQKLQGKMESGQFNDNSWFNPRMGGLNPFASGNAKSYADTARGIQGGDQGRFDAAQKYMTERGNQMPQEAKANLQKQMDELKGRLGTKIPWGGESPKPPEAPTTGGAWSHIRRPLVPGQAQGYAMSPHDYREQKPTPYDPYSAVFNQGSPTAFGG